jgi:ribosomal protein L44E
MAPPKNPKNRYGNRKNDSEVFVFNSTYPRHKLKERIIKQKLIPYKCDVCDNNAIWQNKPMTLILDHINGINNDNRIENLRFVCSNCDSQLPTYKSRNRKGGGAVYRPRLENEFT